MTVIPPPLGTLLLFNKNNHWEISNLDHTLSENVERITQICNLLNVEIDPHLDETFLVSKIFIEKTKKRAFKNLMISINEDHLICSER